MTVSSATISPTDRIALGSDGRLLAGFCGLAAIVGNVLGVAFLWQVPSAYRVARLDAWVTETLASPWASSASAIAFTLGLFALAAWARRLGAELGGELARSGASLIAITALLNGAGTLAPLVVAAHIGVADGSGLAAARGFLGISLAFDALFNFGLGLGLLLMAVGARATSRPLRLLMVLAGVLCLPVSAQLLWDPAADLVLVAAPFWLALILITSVRWLRSRDAPAR